MVFDRTAVAPIARQVPHVHTCHGDERQDPYFWLHQRDDEAVLTFLRAQNDYADALMAPTDALQKTLYAEMRGRIKEDELSAPYRDGDYWYYTRYEAGHEYPIYARRLGSMDADEQIILDVNVLAQGHDYCAVSGVEVSPDHQRVAYAIDTVGRRQYTLHCIEIGSGESIAQPLPGMSPGAIWNADCSDVFAVRNDPETLRPFEVLLHGQTQNAHPVWQEQDDTFAVYVSGTCTEAYVQLVSVSTLTTEIHLIPTSEPLRQPEVFLARRRGHEYYLDHDGEQFYVISNREAKNFCLMATQAPGTPIDAWREISAHNPSELLEDFQLFKHAIVLQFKRDGLTGYRVIDRASGATHEIEFDDPAWLTGLRDNIMFDAPALRFEYESMTTPATVFDYDLTTHERTEVWQDTVLGDFDPSNYEMRQHHVTARDGTRVPVSIVARRDRAPDHKRPLLLYGYGAYGITIDPNFSLTRLSLLDRGFAMAIAHVRGGEYLGRQWYEQGRQRNKYNTFNDFIDVATWLRDQQLCAPDALYAMGGSAGGLLMGVVINDAPELFAGVVAKVPFVDVVTTMLDDQLPLTTGEYDEWGDPNNADTYHFLLRYSPYDNIREQRYPNLLITAGLHDSQVQYFEPAKWVARLRERSTGDALLMLKTEMDAGHSGASGRFESLHEIAREYAFLIGLADEAGALPPGMGV